MMQETPQCLVSVCLVEGKTLKFEANLPVSVAALQEMVGKFSVPGPKNVEGMSRNV